MPVKKATSRKPKPKAKARPRKKRIVKPSDDAVLVKLFGLPDDQKDEQNVIALMKQFGKRTKLQTQKLLVKYRDLVPVTVEKTEMEYLEEQLERRRSLFNVINLAEAVTIETEELKNHMYTVNNLIDMATDDPESFGDPDHVKSILQSIKALVNLLRVNAKEARQLLNDMDTTKARIEFLKQL